MNRQRTEGIAIVSVAMALKALTQNRLQALLTLCGMSVGVAMVVIVSGLGRGAQQTIEQQIESAGPTQITIRSGNYRPAAIAAAGEQDTSGGEQAEGLVPEGQMWDSSSGEAITNEAVERVRRKAAAPPKSRYKTPATALGEPELTLLGEIENVRAVSASVTGNVTLDPAPGVSQRIARVHGFDTHWPELHAWKLSQGRLVSASEHERGAAVMLLSRSVAERLWPRVSPLDQTISIRGRPVRVVGTIDDDPDDRSSVVPTLHLPLPLARQFLNRASLDVVTVRTRSVGTTSRVAAEIKEKLRELHQLSDDTVDDFRVETQGVAAMPGMGMDPRLARAVHSNVAEFEQASWEEMAKSLRQAGRTFTLLLAAAAAVSLLVGGIGVMNIMLVSVAARTREIGLRMAVGARMNDVMIQFMVEAITLAALGGLIGLALGAVGLMFVRYSLHWATAIEPTMLLIAIAMAALTGVIFGYGPARRAAVLDPVIALKSD
jgi:putative ABC transport system permease protein